jgi:hypothetical protein
MMRFLFRHSAALGVALASLSGSYACTSNNCSDVSCTPIVGVVPETPISESGSYEVDFVADGKKMTCTLKVASTAPAQCSDSRAYVAQTQGKGITLMSVDGMYDTLSVTVKRDGQTIASQTFSSLKYVNADFTGAGCVSCPTAQVTLSNGGGGPDASVAKTPDASVSTQADAH